MPVIFILSLCSCFDILSAVDILGNFAVGGLYQQSADLCYCIIYERAIVFTTKTSDSYIFSIIIIFNVANRSIADKVACCAYSYETVSVMQPHSSYTVFLITLDILS
ncbi:MAG: hypothetical protein U0M06_06345 [Clostridia bacterium]|nr:hypothetical protein [Clostridia bacterium]